MSQVHTDMLSSVHTEQWYKIRLQVYFAQACTTFFIQNERQEENKCNLACHAYFTENPQEIKWEM